MAFLDNGTIFEALDIFYRRETEGNRLTPLQMQRLLQVASMELFNVELPNFDATKKLNKSLIRQRTTSTLTVSSGDATYPSDYCRPVLLSTSSGYPIDIISEHDNELYNRLNDTILAPTATYPIAILKNGLISFLPTTVTSPIFTYLAYPADPVFDYVYDQNDIIHYMPVSSVIKWNAVTGYFDMYDKAGVGGVVILASVTHPTWITHTDYTSTSIDLDWNPEDRERILPILIQKLSLNIIPQQLLNYSMREESQETGTKLLNKPQ